MKALYSLILASGTKEAFFAALWLALDEEPGTFADVDFATLRTTAARFGVALSESQIRKRVKELEKLDVLAVAPRRERGRFDLFVYQPAPNRFNVDATAPKPEPATPLFDAAFGVGVESFVGDGAAPDPRYRANSVSAPVGREALAQLRADANSAAVFAAVSETETRAETATESVATSQTAPSKAERADALLARTRFADALRRAIYPSDYDAIHCQTRFYRGQSIDGLSVGEVDLIDWRVGKFVVESRKIVGEYVDRSIAGEYRGRRDVYVAEMNAALLAFAKTRADAIAPEPVEAVDATKAVESIRNRSRSAESESRESVAGPLEEINIKNKTINKPAKDFNRETQAGPEARSVADVRALVDFASPKVAALRREIAEAVWEPTVHPDLIDRLTAAVVLRVGGATRSTVFALIREARDAKSLFERSNGRAGKRTIWETAALRTKRLFENAGW
ncbi:MAG: hypothetical protein IJE97_14405, partial [Thermoguttaceae bacterium]|nr:hypothetical protein [Thermoguttaceae bacterium]